MLIDAPLALIGFAFVMSISPGPGNLIMLTSGVNFGYRRTLPFVLGNATGFSLMMLLMGLGLGPILRANPPIYSALKYVCLAYVLWLAIKIGRSRSMGSNDTDNMRRPMTFMHAVLFQWVNPKTWPVALIVPVTYANPDNYVPSLIAVITVFGLVIFPSTSVWAVSGVALQRLLGTDRRIAVFNIAMAILLVAALLPIIFGLTI